MLQLCIQSVFTNVLLCAFLYIFIQIDCSFDKSTTNLLKATILNALLLMVSDCINIYSVQEQIEPFRYITTAFGYCFRLAGSYMVLILLLHEKGKKTKHLLLVPVIITIVLEFTTKFTNLSFYYDISGQFHRCSLNFLPHVFCGIYILCIFRQFYREYRRNGVGAFVIMYVVLGGIIAMVTEIYFQYRFLLAGVISGGVFVNYLYLHIEIYKRDGLTNLLNRRSFDIFARQNADKQFMVISIDMNNLKMINDTFGHHEGDKAIIAVVDTIQAYLKKGNTLYRMGGDEFIVVSMKLNKEQILSKMERANHKLIEQGYSVAYGIAEHEADADIQAVCKQADSLMYKCKKAMKKGGM